MTNELLVPFALDDEEKLHSPDKAEKGLNYYCPSCHDPLIFRKGKVKVAHFAHKASLTCNNESIVHKIAKLLIQQAVRNWKIGKDKRPVTQRACLWCQGEFEKELHNIIDDAVLEYHLPEGFIVDVALMSKGKIKGAIEIKVSHAVDEIKHALLSVPYLELDGSQIMANSLTWVVINESSKPQFCSDKCKQDHLRQEEAYKKQKEEYERKQLFAQQQYERKQLFVQQQREEARSHGLTLPEWISYKKAVKVVKKLVADGMTPDQFEDEYVFFSQSENVQHKLYELFNDSFAEQVEINYKRDRLIARRMGVTLEKFYEIQATKQQNEKRKIQLQNEERENQQVEKSQVPFGFLTDYKKAEKLIVEEDVPDRQKVLCQYCYAFTTKWATYDEKLNLGVCVSCANEQDEHRRNQEE